MALTDKLTAIGNAIRGKTGGTELLTLDEMATAIEGISGGGGGEEVADVTGVIFEPKTTVPTYSYECYEVTSGTNLSGTIHASKGDWVLATVTTRSATTFPNDWTLLHEGTSAGSNYHNQRMSFLCKQVEEDSEVSINIIQATAGRIYINLVAVKECEGFTYHEGSEQIYTEVATCKLTRPPYPLLLWGCSCNLTSGDRTWLVNGSTTNVIGLGTETAQRQANFFDVDGSAFYTFSAALSDDSASGNAMIIDYVEILSKQEDEEKTYYKVDAKWFSDIVGFLSDISPENGMTIDKISTGVEGRAKGGNSLLLSNYGRYIVTQKDGVYYVFFGSSLSVGVASYLSVLYIDVAYSCTSLEEVHNLIWDKTYYAKLTPIWNEPVNNVTFRSYSDSENSIYANFSSSMTYQGASVTVSKNYAKLPTE